MSKLQSKLKNLPPQLVLKPCDVEFCKSYKNIEEGVKVKLSVSEIEVHLAATTVHTVMGKSTIDHLEVELVTKSVMKYVQGIKGHCLPEELKGKKVKNICSQTL